MSRPLRGHDQLVVYDHRLQQILTAAPPHMTCLARTLKLQIPPLLSCVALDNVDDGKVAYHLQVFRNMPRIDNGFPSWLVLLEKGVVITLIRPESLITRSRLRVPFGSIV